MEFKLIFSERNIGNQTPFPDFRDYGIKDKYGYFGNSSCIFRPYYYCSIEKVHVH